MSRLAPPPLSFADLELRSQGVHLDPLLQASLAFRDDPAALVEQVRQDLGRGLKNPHPGRDGDHSCADLALTQPHARPKLGVSRVAGTHQ